MLVDQHAPVVTREILHWLSGDIKHIARLGGLPCPGVLNLELLLAQLGDRADGDQFAGGQRNRIGRCAVLVRYAFHIGQRCEELLTHWGEIDLGGVAFAFSDFQESGFCEELVLGIGGGVSGGIAYVAGVKGN